MLTESFVASVLSSENTPKNAANRDVGIYFHTYQPLPSLKSTFKKSSTSPNGLVVSTSHIFAAQADKAVVHVYSRERGNQEAIVPFPERITSLALVGKRNGAGTLALGTAGGRMILWELCTGRQVSTPPSHLQATSCLAVDPTSNFLLSGSLDSNIHVWSLPALLSFSSPTSNDPNQPSAYSPSRTLSKHRAAVTSLVVGHSSTSANIAISGSEDNTCIVWDYHTGDLLHTFLLPATPLCLALDPADRAFYAGYSDGSVQLVDFFKPRPSLAHPIHDPSLATTPTQPSPTDRWSLPLDSSSPALCIAISYDGTELLTGHENGKIQTWEVAKGRYSTLLADFAPPAITNLHMLPPVGFLNAQRSALKILNVVKPRYESALNGSSLSAASGSMVPENYTFSAQFVSTIPRIEAPSRNCHTSLSRDDLMTSFDEALTHRSFPFQFLQEGLAALTAIPTPVLGSQDEISAEVTLLRTQLQQARAAQRAHAERSVELSKEVRRRDDEAKTKKLAKKLRRISTARREERARKQVMGEAVEDEEDDEEMGDAGQVSSSTEEMTDSD